jgi:hypothetical protein
MRRQIQLKAIEQLWRRITVYIDRKPQIAYRQRFSLASSMVVNLSNQLNLGDYLQRPPELAKNERNGGKAIDQTNRKNAEKFRKPGVLTARPGYGIMNRQLTSKPAIVATVHTKKAYFSKVSSCRTKLATPRRRPRSDDISVTPSARSRSCRLSTNLLSS